MSHSRHHEESKEIIHQIGSAHCILNIGEVVERTLRTQRKIIPTLIDNQFASMRHEL